MDIEGLGFVKSASVPIPVSQLELGTAGRIVKITTNDRLYRHKLLSMGLIPGTVIQLVRVAPLGDPLEFYTRGFFLSLRRDEASCIEVLLENAN